MNGDIYEQIVQLKTGGKDALLVTVVEREGSSPAPVGAQMLVRPDGQAIGTVGGGALERLALERAREYLTSRRTELVHYSLSDGGHAVVATADEPSGMICGGRVALFFNFLGFEMHLYVLGAGHVGRAIARHAEGLGYYVTLIDHRPGIETSLPGSNRVLIGDYETVLAAETIPQGSYFVIATPSHAFDYAVLHCIMGSGWRPAYVGMLGSRAKVEEMLPRLAEEIGAERVDWSVLYTPVGLDIGGPSPDEVALSILAEIQALRYGKAGHRHMRELVQNRFVTSEHPSE